MNDKTPTSRISGFFRESVERRVELLEAAGFLGEDDAAFLSSGGHVGIAELDQMSENVLAAQCLPMSVALNFRVNRRDVLVPMAVEEPSVVAAASNAARLVRLSGGFFGDADPPVMTAQVQLDGVPDPVAAAQRLRAEREALLALAGRAIPRMVERGGGARDLEVRVLDASEGLVVVHIYVDVGDAMGANLTDTVAEHVASFIHERLGGRLGLRILSNLTDRRCVRVTAHVSADALGGDRIAEGIVKASHFAEVDPYRAATHNKGIMNGIDAAAVAMGQDWRSIEAGAHAFAARDGRYTALATWRPFRDGVEGRLELPLAVGTAGGSTAAHGGIRTALSMTRAESAGELAIIMASAGLACNLAALRALVGEGIQKGHMRLHRRKADPRCVRRSSRS